MSGLNTQLLFRALLRPLRIDTVCDVGSMDGMEARAFRALLPAADIYVLNGVAPGGAAAMARYGLRPCLCSLAQIALWKDSGGGSPWT